MEEAGGHQSSSGRPKKKKIEKRPVGKRFHRSDNGEKVPNEKGNWEKTKKTTNKREGKTTLKKCEAPYVRPEGKDSRKGEKT